MDILRRFTVFAIAALAAPVTMVIGSHLTFPVSQKQVNSLKTISVPSIPASFVNVKVKEENLNKNEASVGENAETVNYISSDVPQISLQEKNPSTKNPYLKLFYFTGKSVHETSLAALFKK
jgi:hypothetical protein